MKFDQFMSYQERFIFSKNFAKNAAWKLVLGPFLLLKNSI